jgi:hypothetical protein
LQNIKEFNMDLESKEKGTIGAIFAVDIASNFRIV